MSAALPTKKLPFSFAKRYGVLCVEQDGALQLVYKPGTSPVAFSEARRFLGQDLQFELKDVSETDFEQALTDAYQQDSGAAARMVEGLGDEIDLDSLADAVPKSEDLLGQEDDAPIIRLINAILNEAVKENASDIHIETYEKSLQVRFRIDGVLREAVQPPRELASLLVSRIKVMAKLDIAEKRVPQDGRISLRIAAREIDIRVSTLPSSYGERVVLRLLDKNSAQLDLSALGMTDSLANSISEIVHRPHGIVLVTGPTGSGKSTTLYAALALINDRSRSILTIEDPIEYNIEGVGQTQVNNKADLSFAMGLRAMLRQDPDVVMVGEIRDVETARIAVQASLTGHLVLSTLHTNSAAGAVLRLRDMGIEPFMLASSLAAVLAQRLVRRLCDHCKSPRLATLHEKEFLGHSAEDDFEVFEARGCEHCNDTGYRGRTGVHELIVIDSELKRLIHAGAEESALIRQARLSSPSLRSDALERVAAGVTTIEEVVRVTLEH